MRHLCRHQIHRTFSIVGRQIQRRCFQHRHLVIVADTLGASDQQGYQAGSTEFLAERLDQAPLVIGVAEVQTRCHLQVVAAVALVADIGVAVAVPVPEVDKLVVPVAVVVSQIGQTQVADRPEPVLEALHLGLDHRPESFELK